MNETKKELLMVARPTYKALECKIKKLEKEALDYMRKEKDFSKVKKLTDFGHMRRTISLMNINEELNREIDAIKRVDKEELAQISDKLRERIKELNCLYDISIFRENNDFSLNGLLQEMVNFIPLVCQHPEITCARIIFDSYDFMTKNFLQTNWKQSYNIMVNNKEIGKLEVYRLKRKSDFKKRLFSEEEKRLIVTIAESIARIVEREWAEAEIRKCQDIISSI